MRIEKKGDCTLYQRDRKLRVLDLFSGIGGFSLGLERTGGFETVAFCEIEPFPQQVLRKHWPEVPIYEDVRTLDGEQFRGSIDVICGGFPCQPFSTASHGVRVAPDLWPEYARIASLVRPRFAIAENVAREPIDRPADHFRSLGMQCLTIRISGDDLRADHTRNRWWAVAHPYENGKLQIALNAEMALMRQIRDSIWGAANYKAAVCLSDGISTGLGGTDAGVFGNAVMPQIPELIGRALLSILNSE